MEIDIQTNWAIKTDTTQGGLKLADAHLIVSRIQELYQQLNSGAVLPLLRAAILSLESCRAFNDIGVDFRITAVGDSREVKANRSRIE